MKDDGNVAVELIFAVTLVCMLFVPAITTIADFADARRDVSSVSNSMSKAWQLTGARPALDVFEETTSRRLAIEARCTPACDSPGAVVTVRVKTYVRLLKEFEISHSQVVVLNKYG
jgi:hypothetical protein